MIGSGGASCKIIAINQRIQKDIFPQKEYQIYAAIHDIPS